MKLITGQKVKIVPIEECFKILQYRNFCTDDETRTRIANEIGGKTGYIDSIEEKYSNDYFFFKLDEPVDIYNSYSIPVQVVEI